MVRGLEPQKERLKELVLLNLDVRRLLRNLMDFPY